MFKSKVDELAKKTKKVTNAVTDTLHSAGTTVSPDTSGALPEVAMPGMGASSEMPLPDVGTGTEVAMPGMGASSEMPLPDVGTGTDATIPGTNSVVSDERLKKVKAGLLTRKKQSVVSNTVVSDANAKKVKGSLIDPSIAAICSWR